MRLSKLLICFLLICALALPMALGESEEPVVTEVPTQKPTEMPTEVPTEKPTEVPTEKPTEAPTEKPPEVPTENPTEAPTEKPTEAPTETPTETPTQEPTDEPTQAPTEVPTEEPTENPTEVPTEKPTEAPTETPTETPTQEPTDEPTQAPTEVPTEEPTDEPALESTATPTESPTEEPTQVPTEKPTETPAQTPTNEPTQEPAEEPTEAPTEAPSEQPADFPTQEPTLEPAQEPEPGVTIESTNSPEPSITPESTITPEPSITPDPAITPEPTFSPPTEPGIPGELVVITCEGNAKLSDGVWEFTTNAPDASIGFSWSVDGTAEMFYLFMDSAYLGETTEFRASLSSQAYMNSQHTLYVGALLDDGSITWGAVNFRIASGGKPGSGFPGGKPSGGSRPSGGSGAAGTPAEEQGFHVTPGKALTSKHSSGTKNTAAYTCSEINDSAEAITVLMLESTQTEITLDGGAAFCASKDDGKLQLVPESKAEEWQLNALAMNTLSASGIDRVVFHLGGTAYSMPARMEFSGSIYASLRAKGYVSKDMEISIDALGVHVSVDGCSYSINDANELIPCEE